MTPLYPSKKAWLEAIDTAKKDHKALSACQKILTKDAMSLKKCLSGFSDLRKEISRMWVWASLQASSDSQNHEYTEQLQLVANLSRKITSDLAYVNPAISQLPEEKLEEFLKQETSLDDYKQVLRDIRIQAKHILSPKEEALISNYLPLASGSSRIFRMLMASDIEFPTVVLSDGSKIVVDNTGYEKGRQLENREDRVKVFEAFFSLLNQYESTFGLSLYQSVQSRTTLAKVRNYPNALSSALGNTQLPEKVYRNLVEQVESNLSILHRYLKLRKKKMGLKNLEYHDLYTELHGTEKKFDIKTSRDDLLEAVKPLGEGYKKELAYATKQKWMDIYPRKGKRSGAFASGGAYEVHPYVLLNHLDDYNSVSTYAHEWGHAMHSVLSNKNQPYQDSRYATFVAETAAIVNEVLLLEHNLKNAESDEEKLFFLDYGLNMLRITFFRQAQFAEFELKLHEMVESGKPLSGQTISNVYGSILERYYGHKEDVVNINPRYHLEWAYVPHFYFGFYVYTYSTSIAASYNFAAKILSGDKQALTAYLNLLKAGGSKYPHELFLDAGLDMTKPSAYQPMFERANEYLESMEKLLDKIERTKG
ncbi:MAG: oligoendopeptidase F [Pseudobacteriovorax sp.]|nr:oligoendopeptidase F [Pseudobacteriovorax sp.]